MGRVLISSAPIGLPLLFAIVACVGSFGTTAQESVVPLQDFNFGNQQVNVTSAAHTFTISPASGVQSNQITSITESCPDFAVSAPGLPATVSNVCTGGGSACTGYAATTYSFTATFTPTVALPSSCVVTVTIDTTPTTFTLTGTGTEPPVRETISPATAIQLGEVRIGDTSAAASILVKNLGSGPQPLTVSSVAFDAAGAASGLAIASGTTGSHAVAAHGGTDPYTVTCAPTHAGAITGTLTIASDDPVLGAATLTVTCTGIMSNLEFLPTSPALLDGTQPQKATRVGEPVDVPIQLKNTGTASMTLHGVTIAGAQLSIASQPAAETVLGIGASTSVVVHFAATAAVEQSTLGTLSVAHDNGQVRTINILGAALDTSMSISPDGAVDLGPVCVGKSATQPFFIVKNSAGTFKINAISQPDAPFSLTGSIPAGGPIAVDASAVQFSAVVTPTAAAALHGSFEVMTDIPGAAPRSISLSAIGLPPGVTPTPATLDLGTVSVGAMSVGQTVTLTNCGDATLTVSQTQLVGADPTDFQVAVPPSSSQIAPGAAAMFVIVAAPTHAGDLTATLQVAYDGGTALVTLAATGTGDIPDTRVPTDSTYYGCRAGGDSAWPVAAIGLLVLRRRRGRR